MFLRAGGGGCLDTLGGTALADLESLPRTRTGPPESRRRQHEWGKRQPPSQVFPATFHCTRTSDNDQCDLEMETGNHTRLAMQGFLETFVQSGENGADPYGTWNWLPAAVCSG